MNPSNPYRPPQNINQPPNSGSGAERSETSRTILWLAVETAVALLISALVLDHGETLRLTVFWTIIFWACASLYFLARGRHMTRPEHIAVLWLYPCLVIGAAVALQVWGSSS